MMIHVIQGSPGTGKTRKMLRYLDGVVKCHAIRNVAFVSFTRKGAYVARDRARALLDGVPDEDFRYFRTIHSLVARALFDKEDEDKPKFVLDADREVLSHLFGDREFFKRLSGSRSGSTKQAPLSFDTMEHEEVYDEYKKIQGKIDFDDLLDMADRIEPLPVEVAFIDEAQDLTGQQWLILKRLFSKAEIWYLAGDINQSLFEWAGADSRQFLSFQGASVERLSVGHRCARAIYEMAGDIIAPLPDGEPLPQATSEEGFVHLTRDMTMQDSVIENILESDCSVMCLGLYYRVVRKWERYLRANGVPYYLGRNNTGIIMPTFGKAGWVKVKQGILLARAWVKGYKAFYKVLCGISVPGIKELEMLQNGIAKRKLRDPLYERLKQDDFKGALSLYMAWRGEDTGYLQEAIDFIMAMVRNGNLYKDPLNVLVSTIHKVKGDECDYVLLNPHLSRQLRVEGMVQDYASVRKALFVALTRAKKGAVVVPVNKGLSSHFHFRELGNVPEEFLETRGFVLPQDEAKVDFSRQLMEEENGEVMESEV